MKVQLLFAELLALAISLTLASCHIDGTSYNADKEKGYAEAAKLILKSVDPGNEKVYYMKFECSQENGNKLETVTIKVVNSSDMAYSQKILLTGSQQALPIENIPQTFEAPVYKDVKGIDIVHFDTKGILKQIENAKTLIPKGNKFKAIYDYTISEAVPAGNEAFNSDEEIGKKTTSFFMSFTQKQPNGQDGFAAVRCIVGDGNKVKFDMD